jgi:hypothetical protein
VHRISTTALLLVACSACASAPPRPSAGSAEGILARAIEASGGAAALERARALAWDGDAVIHAGGRTLSIAGRWQVQPPDTAVVSTYDLPSGPSAMRHLVVAQPRGWAVRSGRFAPLPASVLASERDEFYFYDVLRLVPLRAPGVRLRRIAADSLGQAGIRASQAGRPDVDLFVGADGRPAHLRATITDAESGRPVVQEMWLSGTLRDRGVRWPASLRLTQAGAPFFDLTLRDLAVLPAVRDTLLAGPK